MDNSNQSKSKKTWSIRENIKHRRSIYIFTQCSEPNKKHMQTKDKGTRRHTKKTKHLQYITHIKNKQKTTLFSRFRILHHVPNITT